MKKNKSRKSDRFTQITYPIGYLAETGEGGDIAIDVSTRHYIQVTIGGAQDPVELNAFEARELGRALTKAARRLDGGK